MKAILIKHLSVLAAHHKGLGKCHGERAMKCAGDEKEHEQDLADRNDSLGDHYVELAKACRENFDLENDDSTGVDDVKAFGMAGALARERNLNKLVPTRAMGVMPSDVPTEGLRLIGRPGGPSLEKSKVPAEFADLVET